MKTVHHPLLPATQEVPDEDLGEWLEQGWLEEPTPAADPEYDQLTATVPAVIDHVGTDQERITAALEAERARGDEARPTLVKQLEKLSNQEGPQS